MEAERKKGGDRKLKTKERIKEKKNNNLLMQIKSNFTKYNMEFWNKFYVNDIKDGLNKLIKFYITNNLIYNQNMQQINGSINEILKEKPSDIVVTNIGATNATVYWKNNEGVFSILSYKEKEKNMPYISVSGSDLYKNMKEPLPGERSEVPYDKDSLIWQSI